MHYQIRVGGQLDPKLAAWFDDMTLAYTPDGNTLLTGPLRDQAALHGVLARCRDLGISLIAVNPIESDIATESIDGIPIQT